MVRVNVEGTQEVNASMEAFRRDARNMPDVFDRVGYAMIRTAKSLVPKRSGALQRSIRFRGTPRANIASIRAGGRSTRTSRGGVYAPIAEYGTYTHRSKGPRPFMNQALFRNIGFARREIDNELGNLIDRYDLRGRF